MTSMGPALITAVEMHEAPDHSIDPARPGFTDIRGGSRVDRYLPATARPYARLARWDRPIGWWLLLLPCWWATALAAPQRPDPGLLALFWFGAVVMRGAGCTLNDIIDRDIDAAVERTRVRPIPSGQVTVFQALLFMVAQLALGAVVLFSLRPQVIGLGFAVLVLIATYPFMKRITFWPQLFLGLNFNWGALIGWVAVTGHLAFPAFCLYLAGVAWTLGYDTIYAHQDKDDDALIGVKSTARLFGAKSRDWILGFYTVAFALILGAGYADHAGWPFTIVMLGAGAHLLWQVQTLAVDDPDRCLKLFRSNRETGALIALAFLISSWIV